jgi:hypothetical protein
MADEQPDAPVQPDAIPWWQSKIVVGLAITAVTDLVHIFHLTKYLTQDQIANIADLGLQLAGIGSIAYALRGRLQQKYAAPVTMTKAKAVAINATKNGSSTPPET